MTWDDIYTAGKQDWIKVLRTLSPMLAKRLQTDRLTLSHALHLIGVHTGAFNHREIRPMRYMTDDDKVFTDIAEAEAHENTLARMASLYSEVDAYLATMAWEDASGRAETRLRNYIRGWLAYDIEQHPERYADKPE